MGAASTPTRSAPQTGAREEEEAELVADRVTVKRR